MIPTLNAAATLDATLRSLSAAREEGLVRAIIVSDGGSTDRTTEIAEAAGARVERGPPGRGRQLADGAMAARSPWVLFLHADTRLAAGWERTARELMADEGAQGRAAAFSFALDDPSIAARVLEWLVRWRCRIAALPYGDQGLLMSRKLYDEIGGYRPMPLMEDVDVVRRIGSGRLVILPAKAVTSPARFRREGYVRRGVRNLFLPRALLPGRGAGHDRSILSVKPRHAAHSPCGDIRKGTPNRCRQTAARRRHRGLCRVALLPE